MENKVAKITEERRSSVCTFWINKASVYFTAFNINELRVLLLAEKRFASLLTE
jgi:hypothetical protein